MAQSGFFRRTQMKIKYFYLTLIFISALFLVYILRDNQKAQELNKSKVGMQNPHQNMPDDSIHKNIFQNTPPSKENVSEAFRNKLHELEMKFKANPEKVEVAEELADFYFAAHQNEKAIQIYEKFRNRLSIDALFNLTLAYYNLKDLKKAEEVTRFILKKKPDEHRAIFNLGSIKASMGEKEEAKKYWNEVINRFPKTEEAKKAKEFLAILK